MLRTAFAILTVALLACGADESTQSADSLPPVSATDSTLDTIDNPAAELAEKLKADTEEVTNSQAASCLGLVAKGEFSEAVPVCLEAANIDPENADVQAALAKAKASSASAAADAGTSAAAKALGGALN